MRKARVLLWEQCNRNCEGCCNKDWDLAALPKVNMQALGAYDEIILTGGEPMLHPITLLTISNGIRKKYPEKKLVLYTAKVDHILWRRIAVNFDGVTVTLHAQPDVYLFEAYAMLNTYPRVIDKWLNVFEEVHLTDFQIEKYQNNCWDVRTDYKWIKNCPLPTDEEFVRWTTF
jgi:MoaA/NifB/PqqE/SkfB family radical SAM enzyme